MRATYNIVIADTSCFILLDKIGEMNLLKALFGKIITTSVIAMEFGALLPEWIEIRDASTTALETTLEIDAGEISAIILAIEYNPALLIVDDDKARKVARKLGLNITGSLGIFLKAKQAGIIPSVMAIIQKVQQTNFRYSQAVLNEILELAGE